MTSIITIPSSWQGEKTASPIVTLLGALELFGEDFEMSVKDTKYLSEKLIKISKIINILALNNDKRTASEVLNVDYKYLWYSINYTVQTQHKRRFYEI